MKRQNRRQLAVAVVQPSLTLDRATAVDQILAAAWHPCPEIVPTYEIFCSDGQWRSVHSLPWGVSSTGERRLMGYVLRGRDGCTYGTRHATAEELREKMTRLEDAKTAEFRHILDASDDDAVARQASYWLKVDVSISR